MRDSTLTFYLHRNSEARYGTWRFTAKLDYGAWERSIFAESGTPLHYLVFNEAITRAVELEESIPDGDDVKFEQVRVAGVKETEREHSTLHLKRCYELEGPTFEPDLTCVPDGSSEAPEVQFAVKLDASVASSDESEADAIIAEELDEGTKAAQAFAEHLHRMGAAMTSRKVTVEGRKYRVTVEAE